MLWKQLLAGLLGIVIGRSALAVIVAADDASDPAYSAESGGAWKGLEPTVNENPPGTDNGGFGFLPWNFEAGAHDATATPYGNLNHFIDGVDFAPSLFNDLGSPAFGLTNANIALAGFTARATRPFSEPLAVGGTFRLEFDNPVLAPLMDSDRTGYIIRLNTGGAARIDSNPNVYERLGFFAMHGFNQGNWNRTDSMGEQDVGLHSTTTTSGAVFQVTLQTDESYSLEILPLDGGAPLYSATGNLANPDTGSIDTLEVVLFSNGSGNGLTGPGALPTGEREFFFDALLLDNPAAALVGDYNRNGRVDAADYVLWRNTLNQMVPIGEGADGNRDGVISQPDYDLWRQHFGTSAVGAATGSSNRLAEAPEPGTITALWLGVVLAALHRTARRVRRRGQVFAGFSPAGVTIVGRTGP